MSSTVDPRRSNSAAPARSRAAEAIYVLTGSRDCQSHGPRQVPFAACLLSRCAGGVRVRNRPAIELRALANDLAGRLAPSAPGAEAPRAMERRPREVKAPRPLPDCAAVRVPGERFGGTTRRRCPAGWLESISRHAAPRPTDLWLSTLAP